MKRIFSLGLIATVLAAFTFTSCSKDDDDDASIVGKWSLTSVKIASGGESITISKEELSDDILEFKDNGTFKAIIEEDGVKDEYSGTYKISGNTLTTTDEDGTENIKFSISGNKLTLQYEYYYDEENDEEYETQPAGKNYPKVTESLIYIRM